MKSKKIPADIRSKSMKEAQNDIMRLLCIKILQYQFNDEDSELWDRCNQVKADNNISVPWERSLIIPKSFLKHVPAVSPGP